ncbi:hypothetical protein BRYFOR_06078 [Marvinbryantia formatexigens DSM 14469]|uniref:Uncharacterized protein n=1 Tax=Marvinbryantia formatexigens DSM 14469 TaxID=478749 RepID=C6LBT3_9FIRM|nr:hypothetical protein BRYFOR_06078 [Marvinbryantia formatexigens DSM 14469]
MRIIIEQPPHLACGYHARRRAPGKAAETRRRILRADIVHDGVHPAKLPKRAAASYAWI